MNDDQDAPEGTKTSPQKRAGREVIKIGGTRRDSSKSARLPKKTRWRGSHSINRFKRGTGTERCALWFAIKIPGALSIDTRRRGEKTDPIIAPFRGEGRVTRH